MPPYMQPFVLPVAQVQLRREGIIDIYAPAEPGEGLLPVILFVPGGPLPPGMEAAPRDWPVFAGYGSLAAANGAIGIVVSHGLNAPTDFAAASDAVAAAAEQARALPGADPDRVALWFFSGSGLLEADWLRGQPDWLRISAASYPVMAPLPGMEVEERFRPVEALTPDLGIPLLVTRVGLEAPFIAPAVDAFVDRARELELGLDVIDVPDGHHSFDIVDDSDSSRAALQQAMDRVTEALRRQ